MNDYHDTSLTPQVRAELLLKQMTLEEKICQVQADMIFDGYEAFEKRNYLLGSVRNRGHFLFKNADHEVTHREVARAVNRDTKLSIEKSRLGIPVLQNGEALHGAQCDNATCFPQAIGLASTFDDQLVYEVSSAVGKELRALGVRQVFAPVVNIVRDCRWGRTEETYGEDVCLTSRMGVSYTRGLEEQGVLSAPKHFVDNYADGGRDSNYSHTSWRELREVYLEPFRACVQEGGASSIMAAYNSLDGVPCTCNEVLLTEILREEWGFDGVVISDYGGVDGVFKDHRVAKDLPEAVAVSMKAGLDIDLPYERPAIREALERGLLTEEDLDRAVLRILKCKFQLGLFEEPLVDEEKTEEIVCCQKHLDLARRAAEKSMILLKNDHSFFPLKPEKIKKIGLFGPSVNTVNAGGYSGPYGGWKSPHALTPYQAFCAYLDGQTEVVCNDSDEGIEETAKGCDIILYFSTTLEGEGSDRGSLDFPNKQVAAHNHEGQAIIVGDQPLSVSVDQNKILDRLIKTGIPMGMVLINGSPVNLNRILPHVSGILEAWYPGQMGSEAIAATVFGDNNPGGKLPISFPKDISQLPLCYSFAPSGRSYSYIDNDGKPLFPFGYGLSYTTFSFGNPLVSQKDGGYELTFPVKNTGERKGDEVAMLFIRITEAEVVRPMMELKNFQRITLLPGEEKQVTLKLTQRDLSFYDKNMVFGPHPGTVKLMLGNSSDHIIWSQEYSN